MTLSTYLENKLSRMVTEKTMEYISKGYMIKSGDSSIGYLFRVELTKLNGEYIRISVENESVYEFGSENPIRGNKLVFRVEKFIGNEWSKGELLEEESYYVHETHTATKTFTRDEMEKAAKISSDRFYSRLDRNVGKWEKKPNQKINIRGFKTVNPENILIKKDRYSYTIENLVSGKIKKIKR